MSRTKVSKKCAIKGCKKPKRTFKGRINGRFCSAHASLATPVAFLGKLYRDMKARVTGTNVGHVADRSRHLYVGKPILPRDVFMTWAKNNSDFLNLYKRYVMNNFERRLAPSVNRVDSRRGYTLDNMMWMTSAQNSGLSGEVTKMKNKQMIYAILGVNK